MTDVDDEERQETEEEAAERRQRLARFDWSFAKDVDIVYGLRPGTDDEWLVLPRAMLEEIAHTREVVSGAQTWGEVRRGVPAWRLDEMAEMMEAEPEQWFGEDAPYEGLTFADIPDDRWFSGPTYGDEMFPDWPDRAMRDWLPWDILNEFGGEGSGMVSNWYSIVDIEELLEGLRSGGATCEEDDGLVWAAHE